MVKEYPQTGIGGRSGVKSPRYQFGAADNVSIKDLVNIRATLLERGKEHSPVWQYPGILFVAGLEGELLNLVGFFRSNAKQVVATTGGGVRRKNDALGPPRQLLFCVFTL